MLPNDRHPRFSQQQQPQFRASFVGVAGDLSGEKGRSTKVSAIPWTLGNSEEHGRAALKGCSGPFQYHDLDANQPASYPACFLGCSGSTMATRMDTRRGQQQVRRSHLWGMWRGGGIIFLPHDSAPGQRTNELLIPVPFEKRTIQLSCDRNEPARPVTNTNALSYRVQ